MQSMTVELRAEIRKALDAKLAVELPRTGVDEDSDGIVLWEGPSPIDGEPIVIIAVGFAKARREQHRGANGKTGAMVQIYALLRDVCPVDAAESGADRSICKDCSLRPSVHVPTPDSPRPCYVKKWRGPRAVRDAWLRGRYPTLAESELGIEAFRDLPVRFGAYGEPTLIPFQLVQRIAAVASGWTGYTQRWRERSMQKYRRYFMASTQSPAATLLAELKGWRAFESMPAQSTLRRRKGFGHCPASAEMGHKLKCSECLACCGTGSGRRGHVGIWSHR